MIRLDMVRHAETFDEEENLITGLTNSELTEPGIQSALNLDIKKDYDCVVTSEFPRALETMELSLINNPYELPIVTDWRLNELDYGELEKTPKKKIIPFEEGDLFYIPGEGGECFYDLSKRIYNFLEDIEKSRYEKILIFSHKSPIKVLMGILGKFESSRDVMNLSPDNCKIYSYCIEKLEYPQFLRENSPYKRSENIEFLRRMYAD